VGGRLQSQPGFIASRLKQAARQQRLFYLAIDLPYYEQALVPALRAEGFRPHLKHLPPSGLPTATLLLDLKPGLEALLAQMRTTTRYEIRKGVKLGVTVRQGTRADLPLFWELLIELCNRRRCTPNVAGLPFLNTLWDGFSAAGRIDVLVAELTGSPVYALILLGFGNWSWAWRVGATDKCAKCHGAQVTYWEAIKLAKTQGAETFDLLGIYPAPDGNIVDAPICEGNPLQGITFFKLGFGGKPLHVPGTFGLFPNPVLRFFLKIGGEKLAATEVVQKVLEKGQARGPRKGG
jgi:lipid II:glycine glycyltransferase (peptidoglycan interpeptide bridge formation enzyme)